jgi:hypothetical protein
VTGGAEEAAGAEADEEAELVLPPLLQPGAPAAGESG